MRRECCVSVSQMLVLCNARRIKRTRVAWMLLWAFVINSVLICSVVSLAQCSTGDGVPYISEVMLLCKRGVHAFVPWLCFVAFAALVVVQLSWMEHVAREWRKWCAYSVEVGAINTTYDGRVVHEWRVGHVIFWFLAIAAVAGFGCVVRFDWRDTSAVEMAMHKTGVVLLAFGGFGALQVVWVMLRSGDSVARLRGEVDGYVFARDVPFLSWVEVDVVFVVVLAVFMVTTLIGSHAVVSAVFEYIAFGMLLGQTTWLFVLCWERDRWARGRIKGRVVGEMNDSRATRLLWALLTTYAVEAVVVLVVVL